MQNKNPSMTGSNPDHPTTEEARSTRDPRSHRSTGKLHTHTEYNPSGRGEREGRDGWSTWERGGGKRSTRGSPSGRAERQGRDSPWTHVDPTGDAAGRSVWSTARLPGKRRGGGPLRPRHPAAPRRRDRGPCRPAGVPAQAPERRPRRGPAGPSLPRARGRVAPPFRPPTPTPASGPHAPDAPSRAWTRRRGRGRRREGCARTRPTRRPPLRRDGRLLSTPPSS